MPTIQERIIELNTVFQRSYYDKDAGYFKHTAPQLMGNILSVINAFVRYDHPLRVMTDQHMERINKEIEDLKELPANANGAVKDNYINHAKRNISAICWDYIHSIWNYDAKILEQVSEL